MSNMYDEQKGIAEIKALSQDARAHLSHVVRNGLCNILSAHCRESGVEDEIQKFEEEITGLGL